MKILNQNFPDGLEQSSPEAAQKNKSNGKAKSINPNFPDGLETMPVEDRRNIVDVYKYWKHEAILADLDTKRSELVLVCENFAYDFNIATVVRNANAFLPACIWIVGRKSYDRRGTVGMHKYEHIKHSGSIDQVLEQYPHHRIVAIDNVGDAESIDTYRWRSKTLMILGQESIGVSNASLNAADDIIYIPQLGSVRSLNVGTASGIALYDYNVKKHKHFMN